MNRTCLVAVWKNPAAGFHRWNWIMVRSRESVGRSDRWSKCRLRRPVTSRLIDAGLPPVARCSWEAVRQVEQ
jgi:hypothetical protein